MLSCSSVILQTRISIQRLVSGKFIFPIVTKIDRHSIAARSLTRCVDRFFASISVVDINIVLQIRLIFLIAHRSVGQRVDVLHTNKLVSNPIETLMYPGNIIRKVGIQHFNLGCVDHRITADAQQTVVDQVTLYRAIQDGGCVSFNRQVLG